MCDRRCVRTFCSQASFVLAGAENNNNNNIYNNHFCFSCIWKHLEVRTKTWWALSIIFIIILSFNFWAAVSALSLLSCSIVHFTALFTIVLLSKWMNEWIYTYYLLLLFSECNKCCLDDDIWNDISGDNSVVCLQSSDDVLWRLEAVTCWQAPRSLQWPISPDSLCHFPSQRFSTADYSSQIFIHVYIVTYTPCHRNK